MGCPSKERKYCTWVDDTDDECPGYGGAEVASIRKMHCHAPGAIGGGAIFHAYQARPQGPLGCCRPFSRNARPGVHP